MVRHGVAVWYPWRVYMSGILYGGGAIPLCLCQSDIKIKRQRRLNPCLSMCLHYTVFELQNYIVVLFTKSER